MPASRMILKNENWKCNVKFGIVRKSRIRPDIEKYILSTQYPANSLDSVLHQVPGTVCFILQH